jgi:hypothetical protein
MEGFVVRCGFVAVAVDGDAVHGGSKFDAKVQEIFDARTEGVRVLVI